jgi:hypothetical protein
MCAQTRKKKNLIVEVMENIILLLPVCATTAIGQEIVYETVVISPK